MHRIIMVLAAIMMLCGSNIALQAMERQQPAGGEGGGSPITTAPTGGSTKTTTAPTGGATKTTTTTKKQTVAQQCAVACHGSRCSSGGVPSSTPTGSAIQGSGGTSVQPGGCKAYQQCMNSCINAAAR